METLHIQNDISVMYVTATSFPEGIGEAYRKLHELTNPKEGRITYGISRPENGELVYKAAVNELFIGEAAEKGLEHYIIRRGTYAVKDIMHYMEHLALIGDYFQQLIHHPDIDPQGECIEWYVNDQHVKCMVRLKDGE